MPRILISDNDSTRPYYVDASWDDFAPRILPITQYRCEELLAYYRGEEVTPSILKYIRGSICNEGALPPLPIRSIGRSLTFECSDGTLETSLDLSTLKRHFELVSDLYELDSSLSSIELPFPKSTVNALMCLVTSDRYGLLYERHGDMTPLMKYMRPFRASAFFEVLSQSEEVEVDFLTDFIAPNMAWEEKLLSARWSTIVPDDSIWPLIEHLHSRRLISIIGALLSKRPLGLLVYDLLTGSINPNTFTLIMLDSYDDEREVNFDLGSINIREMAETVASTMSYRSCSVADARVYLTLLGISHLFIGNDRMRLHCPLVDYLGCGVSEELKRNLIKKFFIISGAKGEDQVLGDLLRH